jgi:virginiamycin B lyase
MRSQFKLLALLGLVACTGFVGRSATISGTVKGVDGAPFQGAFVEAQNTQSKINTIVLSDSQGHYNIANLMPGEYRVQIKAVGFTATAKSGVNLTAEQKASFDFALQPGVVRWSDVSQVTGRTLFPAGKGKDLLFENCSICHAFQSRMAAVRRDADGWKDRVQYMKTAMHFSLAAVSDEDLDTIATYLNSLFGQDSVLAKSPADVPGYKDTLRPFTSDAMNIVYVEYDMPGPSRMPFSAAPDKNGFIWIPNFGVANKISRLDPKTGEMQDYPVPNIGTAAVHSTVPAPDGSVWSAEQGSNKVARWDPTTKTITEYQDTYAPGKEGIAAGGEKHTVRVDIKGNVWASGVPLTKFDPETKKFTHYPEIKQAYDVKPAPNGDVWFTFIRENKVGYVDAKTDKIKLYEMPTPKSLPRRMEIASDGTVWIGEFLGGKLAKLDPKTGSIKEYVLPGPDPTPYALGIDADGNVWYDSHHQDTINKFDVKTEKVTEYPFPQAELSMREFFRDAQGRMWFGTNPNNKVGYFYLAGKSGVQTSSN